MPVVTAALRKLHRLRGGDAEDLGETVREIAAAAERAEEPIVIKVESFGVTELVTLREYIEAYIQDWEIGLEDARMVVAEAPGAFVYNWDEAFRHPECLQLHSATDPSVLASEIERLTNEAGR